MSDFDAGADASVEAEVSAAEEAPAVEAPPAAPTNPETVSWADHVKLRDENAKYRQKWSPVAKVFEGYSPEDQAFLSEKFLPTFHENPREFARMAREMADNLEKGFTPEEVAEVTEEAESKGLNPEQVTAAVAAELDRRNAEAQLEADVQTIFKRVDEHWPHDGPRGRAVIGMAANEFKDDPDPIAAAIKAQQDDDQKLIDEYAAGKRGPKTTPGSGAAPIPAGPDYGNMSWAEFRRDVKAGLNARSDATQ